MSEFKVGDRVRIVNEDICGENRIGKICKKFLNYANINRNLYEVDFGATYPYEIFEEDLELYEEKEEIEENKKLITLDELLERIEKLEEIVNKQNNCQKNQNNSQNCKISAKNEEIISKSQLLTEDERVILRNVVDDYRWISRDKDGGLHIFESKPDKEHDHWSISYYYSFESLCLFRKLFQFIKWTDKEPYNIEELLKGESKNEKRI